MAAIKQLFSQGKPIPFLILLIGLLIVANGFFTAIYYRPQLADSIPTMTVDPFIYQGIFEAAIGLAVTVLGYLLYHGKISYFNKI